MVGVNFDGRTVFVRTGRQNGHPERDSHLPR